MFDNLLESIEEKKRIISVVDFCEGNLYENKIDQNLSRKKFQTLYSIDMDDLVEFVDSEDEKTIVLVHICQHNIRACTRLNEVLAQISIACPYIKIGYIEETGNQFKKEMLPILIVYQNGDVLESHIRIIDEIGHNFDFDDILNFLLDRKYVSPSEVQCIN
ncbi:phosducin-like protein 1 [Schistocerca gregaria]|uniref:phosducin-like protein 1 n=1 Tax=Schistocerca gregaria TaxID=7010 RepID=UPI00211E7DD0|nr:phosducin-like protein 1 [Schistocerca gregaria]